MGGDPQIASKEAQGREREAAPSSKKNATDTEGTKVRQDFDVSTSITTNPSVGDCVPAAPAAR